MISRCITGGVAMLMYLLAALPVHADATLVIQGSDGLRSMIQIKDGRGKMSTAGSEDYVIYDSGAGIITYVEPQQRRYTQVSREQLEADVETARGLSEGVASYMEGMLASLPPAQRNMIRQRMGTVLSPPAAGPAPKGDTRTVARGMHSIAGLPCKASGILKNGRPAAEVCMLTSANGRLSQQDFATLEAMVVFSRGLASSAGSLLGDLGEPFEFLALDVDGVPVAVRDLEHGKSYRVTAVSDAALSVALFNGYSRFERRDMPSLSLLRE